MSDERGIGDNSGPGWKEQARAGSPGDDRLRLLIETYKIALGLA